MATTRLLTIHINKGKSIATTLKERTDYANNSEKTVSKIIGDSANYAANSDKTSGGNLVKCYECDPHTVDVEFLLTKKEYDFITGRSQGAKNVLAYHIRQSFKPGEITPEKALEIGYELGLRFTGGKHAFIVATHTDRPHIHNHIVFNSTALCCTKKFRDFKRSGMALQKVSDLLCLEHGLSVIENPGQSKGRNYHKWLGNKEPSAQDKLRQKIDEILPTCATFDAFLAALESDGFKVNAKRKHITVLVPGQKKPARLNTLKGEHTQEAILRRIAAYKKATPASNKVSWLIDIESKIRDGKGAGYEQWATIFNIKESAKTLIYLKEQGIGSYEELARKSDILSQKFSEISTQIKSIESRQKEIAELQRQIGTYGKTRDIYAAYKRSGFCAEFYEKNRANITLHEAAKKHFDSLGLKKFPKMVELKQEYATLQADKKRLYSGYHEIKKQNQEFLIAKHNVARLLDIKPEVNIPENNLAR